jgi:hypothetical protein
MTVIGHLLLYLDKDGAVWCMMFIDLLDDCCSCGDRGVVAEGRGDVNGDVDEWDPGKLITSPCDSDSVSEG